MLRGGCFCGRVRYEADGTPAHSGNCHCEMCRRLSGAPFVAWFTVPRVGFRFVAGQPARFRSSGPVLRSFCPVCGTHLTFEDDKFPNETEITTCSLDDPNQVPPRYHTYVRSRVSWVRLADSLAEYPGDRLDG